MNFLIAVLILIAGWVVARWVGRWVHNLIDRSHYIDETLKPLMSNFARYGILAITVVAVLSQFGVQTTSLIALLGAAGLAIGLALQGTLSNVASGVMLLILRPFRVYDKIKVERCSRHGARDRAVPHRDRHRRRQLCLHSQCHHLLRHHRQHPRARATRRTNFTVEIDRSENIDTVQKPILESWRGSRACSRPRRRSSRSKCLGPISTTLTVQAWVQNSDFGATLSDIKKRVRDALQGGDVGAPVPVPAPAVAPWTPPPEQPRESSESKKPN